MNWYSILCTIFIFQWTDSQPARIFDLTSLTLSSSTSDHEFRKAHHKRFHNYEGPVALKLFLKRCVILSCKWYGLAPESVVGDMWWLYQWTINSTQSFSTTIARESADFMSPNCRAACTQIWICCRALSCCRSYSKLAAFLSLGIWTGEVFLG